MDSIDHLHIVGELANNTNDNLEFVRITANLFDAGDNLVDTDFTYTFLDTLPAHERTCFHLIFDNPAGWSRY